MPVNMLRYIRNVSVSEGELLDAIEELRFGEIYGIQLDEGEFLKLRELSDEEWKLVSFLRLGKPYIDILQVHMGQPQMALQDRTIGPFRCQKKTKFST